MAAALADDLGEIGLRIAELAAQPLVAARLFHGVEVGALHVLDDGEFQRLLVGRRRPPTGTSASLAAWAARQRRSPAMIS